jgi:hypothetical protein
MIGTIALDMDGVLYDWDTSVRTLACADMGCEDWGAARTWEIPFLNHDEGRQWYAANLERVFTEGNMVSGADWGVKALMRLTPNLTIVTSGEPEIGAFKEFWMKKVGIAYDNFVLLDKTIHVAGKPGKSQVPADLYIDDASHVVDEVIDNTPAWAILRDRPYNSGAEAPKRSTNPRLLRAYSWHGIVKMAEFVDYRLGAGARAI